MLGPIKFIIDNDTQEPGKKRLIHNVQIGWILTSLIYHPLDVHQRKPLSTNTCGHTMDIHCISTNNVHALHTVFIECV